MQSRQDETSVTMLSSSREINHELPPIAAQCESPPIFFSVGLDADSREGKVCLRDSCGLVE
jgi:hypothetical protein